MIEKKCSTCKYNLPFNISSWQHTPIECTDCASLTASVTSNTVTGVELKNWTPKEEPDHLKGEFYVKLICDINGTEVEISEIKLNDFVKNITAEVTDSILKNLKGENLEQ